MRYTSTFLKAALFATGLAGIVSEYTLSTLATYFLGDSVFQWTMIVSIMLFSMGLGSRLSKNIENNLLRSFILLEFGLSLLASNVTVIVYVVFALFGNTLVVIYSLSILVGLMIGMEIPLVIRLNEQFQSLRFNVSSAMENDYYGSLAGGVFFAFIGLPILGLTYTPIILGTVNFLVAVVFLVVVWREIASAQKRVLAILGVLVVLGLITTGMLSENAVRWGDEVRYKDEIVFSQQSRYQKIVLTKNGDHHWLYINGHQQLSTLDEVLYHEPLVHPVMMLHPDPGNILVLGGGDGAAVREVLKYPIESVTVVDLDPVMTRLASTNEVLASINNQSFGDPRVKLINQDAFTYLDNVKQAYDIIIADFPDPRTIDLGRLYSKEFYWLCKKALNEDGLIVTQATSPYYANAAFSCIEKSMLAAGFKTLPLHNQVVTLGEWGWIIGSIEDENLKKKLQSRKVMVPTQWLTNSSLEMMTTFGKKIFPEKIDEIRENRIHDPVLYRYYLKGYWDLY